MGAAPLDPAPPAPSCGPAALAAPSWGLLRSALGAGEGPGGTQGGPAPFLLLALSIQAAELLGASPPGGAHRSLPPCCRPPDPRGCARPDRAHPTPLLFQHLLRGCQWQPPRGEGALGSVRPGGAPRGGHHGAGTGRGGRGGHREVQGGEAAGTSRGPRSRSREVAVCEGARFPEWKNRCLLSMARSWLWFSSLLSVHTQIYGCLN